MTTGIKARDTEREREKKMRELPYSNPVNTQANHRCLWFADFSLHANVGPAGGHNYNSAKFRVGWQCSRVTCMNESKKSTVLHFYLV